MSTPYFKDPIMAAYMSEQFKVKFVGGEGEADDKIFIRNDCRKIFEPQKGDIGLGCIYEAEYISEGDIELGIEAGEIRRKAGWYNDEGCGPFESEIIQRNDIPFMDYHNPKIGGE